MLSVVKYIKRDHGIKLKAEEVFLVDDDPDNIASALKFNHRALLLEPNTTLGSINFYLNQLQSSEYQPSSAPISPNSCKNLTSSSSLLGPTPSSYQDNFIPQSWLTPQAVINHSYNQHSTHSLPSAAYQAHQSLFPAPWFRPTTLPSCSYYIQN